MSGAAPFERKSTRLRTINYARWLERNKNKSVWRYLDGFFPAAIIQYQVMIIGSFTILIFINLIAKLNGKTSIKNFPWANHVEKLCEKKSICFLFTGRCARNSPRLKFTRFWKRSLTMKLFQTLSSIALVSAQAPPEPKNCADCIVSTDLTLRVKRTINCPLYFCLK